VNMGQRLWGGLIPTYDNCQKINL